MTTGRNPAGTYSFSAAATTLLQEVETLKLMPYDDQTGEITSTWVSGATIGYGHLIDFSEWDAYKNGITQAAASELFDRDAMPFVSRVRADVTAPVTQNEFDALVILAFNIGGPSFSSSSVVKLVNDPAAQTRYPNLQSAWLAWNKSQGKVMPGLTNRRKCEWQVYESAIYTRW